MDESELQGRTVLDSEGGKVGKISEVYIDPDTQRPQWGLIHTGLFGTKASFVPLINVQPEGDDLRFRTPRHRSRTRPRWKPEESCPSRRKRPWPGTTVWATPPRLRRLASSQKARLLPRPRAAAVRKAKR